MRTGATVGALVGGVLGILMGGAFIALLLTFDDTKDGVAPVVLSGIFLMVLVTAAGAAFGAIVVGLVRAMRR